MARVECPIVVLNATTGLPVSGASVQIKLRSSGLNATWWTQETGGTSSTAAVTTDAAGRTNAWVDRGAYNCTVSGTGITTYTEPWDAAPAGDSAIDALWLPDNVIQSRHLSDNAVNTAEIADAAITAAKVGTTAKQLFPQLFTTGTVRMKYGSVSPGSSWGATPTINLALAHGLGSTPTWATVWSSVGNTTGDTEDPIIVSLRSLDSTNINIRARTASGGNANFPGNTFYWLVLG